MLARALTLLYFIQVSLAFLITSLIIVVSPGTGVIYTVATGLSRGRRTSIVAAFGCTMGILPQLAAAIVGLAAVLHASEVAFQTLKYLGVAYLLYLAWGAIRERGSLDLQVDVGGKSALRIVVTAILINVLNPKLSIFFFAFLPQFISPKEGDPIAHTLLLGGVFMAMTFVVFVCYGLLAASVRNQVLARPRVLKWLRRTFAGAFVALAAKLALSER